MLIYGREDGEQHVFCGGADCGGPPDQLRATRDRWVGIDYMAEFSCGTGEQVVCRVECYGDLPESRLAELDRGHRWERVPR